MWSGWPTLLTLLPVFALAPAPRADSGALTFVQTLQNGMGGVEGLAGARGLAVSADGKNVYVASETDNAVAVFDRSPATGLLFFAEAEKQGTGGVDGLAGAAAVAVSPDGAHVYVASAGDNAIAIFGRSTATGVLSFVSVVRNGTAGVDGLTGVRSVAVSPDGAHVYAAASEDRALVVFSRDPASGVLTFVEKEVDGVAGVVGLAGAAAVVVSPDGANVYAAGNGDDSVAVFSRDPTTGRLTFVEREKNGANGVEGLAGPSGLALSPDGAYLHVAAAASDAVAVFARNPVTGALVFVEKQQNGAEGVDGLNSPLAVAVSPEGGYLYAAAASSGSVLVFIRNRTTGKLAFLERQENGIGAVAGLAGANGVMPSPDSLQLYSTAGVSSAVDVFEVTLGITTTTTTTTTTLPRRSRPTSTTLAPCGSAPRTDCREPIASGAALLVVKHPGPLPRDVLRWRWREGAATSLADFGDPRRRTGYRLCIYQAWSGGPQLVLDAKAPPDGRCGTGRCWMATPQGVRYRSPALRPDGLRRIVLRAGGTGQAAITVVGTGRRLALPPLPLTPPLTVQLRAGNGVCWGATYGAALVNSATRFRAKSD